MTATKQIMWEITAKTTQICPFCCFLSENISLTLATCLKNLTPPDNTSADSAETGQPTESLETTVLKQACVCMPEKPSFLANQDLSCYLCAAFSLGKYSEFDMFHQKGSKKNFTDVLPDDISREIFSFLTPRQLCQASLCCQKWNEICGHDSVW